MRAIVTGMIATYPVGGVVWDYGQYALGLEQLGFDVYYLEDTGWQTYDPKHEKYSDDPSYSVQFLPQALSCLSPTLGQRWHFRHVDGRTFGISATNFAEIIAGADVFINVSGGTMLRDDYMSCKRKVLIDTDPGWNHFRNYLRWDANPGWQGSHGYRAHDFFFTYAERLGQTDCPLPNLGLPWHPTRPPVVMSCWQPESPGSTWTTVMTWKNFQETIEHNGVIYGTKEMEFGSVETLPLRVDASLEVAVGGGDVPRQKWRDLGWSVVDSQSRSQSADTYRAYVQRSRGEFSVAKNVYVATRSGWFSCRSVCYLASGRPVVVQDTGFSNFIPTGHGLFAFATIEEAAQAVNTVESSYIEHQEAARDLARTHFNASMVLSQMLERIGL